MRKQHRLFSIVIFLLLAGCSPGFGGGDSRLPVHFEDFRIGTEGVQLEFLQDMPPLEAHTRETFNVGVSIHNKGAEHASPVVVLLSGYDPGFYQLSPNPNMGTTGLHDITSEGNRVTIGTLEGRHEYNTEGGVDHLIFTMGPVSEEQLPPGEDYRINLAATVCYDYKTVYQTSVCIDPKQGEPLKKVPEACEVEQFLDISSGQGGPVAVTRVEQEMVYPNGIPKVQFKIYLNNQAGGNVVRENSAIAHCAKQGSVKGEDRNVVLVSAKIGSEENPRVLSCFDPRNEQSTEVAAYKLEGKQEYVVCKLDLSSQQGKQAFVSTLKVDVRYGYVEEAEKQIRIEK